MFCVKCGKQIDDEAVFCPFCGVDLITILEGVNSNNSLSDASDRNPKKVTSCQHEVDENMDNLVGKSEKVSHYKGKKTKRLSMYSVAVIILSVILIILCILIKLDIWGVVAI